MLKKYSTYLLLLLNLMQFTNCNNYYNETIKWMDSIDGGTTIENVKENQPDFIIIDWKNGISLDDGKIMYPISEIKGNNEILNMSHYLIFKNDRYHGRKSSK